MTLLLIAALSFLLDSLIIRRKLEKQLAVEREDFRILREISTRDFKQTMRLAQMHDRLLGEKNNLLAANEKLRAELRRRHRKLRVGP